MLFALVLFMRHNLEFSACLAIKDHNAFARFDEVMFPSTSCATDGCRKNFKTFRFDLIVTDFTDHRLVTRIIITVLFNNILLWRIVRYRNRSRLIIPNNRWICIIIPWRRIARSSTNRNRSSSSIESKTNPVANRNSY